MVDDGQADAADPAQRRADLERRLDAGEWLTVPEVADLFGVHRNTPHRWGLRTRLSSPKGGTSARLCHPDDVRALLRKVRGEEE